MTVDIHFQINEDEPEGYKALAVLSTWEQQGYPVDEVMQRALLALGERQQASQTSSTAVYVKDIIKQMRDLLEEVQTLKVLKPGEPTAGGSAPAEAETAPPEVEPESEPEKEAAQLSQAFLNAVKKAARPGLRLDQ